MRLPTDRAAIRVVNELYEAAQENSALARAVRDVTQQALTCSAEGFNCLKGYVASKLPKDVPEDKIFGCAIATGIYGSTLHPAVLQHITANTLLYSKGEIESNPYYTNIKLEECNCGKFSIREHCYDVYSLDVLDTYYATTSIFSLKPRFYGFEYEFRCPAICEGKKTWMSISPSEIVTMQPNIDECHGKVLTLGCGLGYFAYMASLKDNVSDITIIEKNDDVIELFTTKVLPQFQHKEKIHIVKADALDYLSTLEDGTFDYCFADLWDGSSDVEIYIKTKRLGNRFSKMHMAYWIERSVVYSLATCTVSALELGIKMGADLSKISQDSLLFKAATDIIKRAKVSTVDDVKKLFTHKRFMSVLNTI